jgi:cobalamin biosynthesis Mg chelatase CobN
MEETSEAEVLSFMLPYNTKFKIIAAILKSKRKEYVLNMEDIKRAAAQDAKFSTQDALLFLGTSAPSAPAPATEAAATNQQASSASTPAASARRKSSAGLSQHESGRLQRQSTASNLSTASKSDGDRGSSRSRSNTEDLTARPRVGSSDVTADQTSGAGALVGQPSMKMKSVSTAAPPAPRPSPTAEALILRSANATAVAMSALHQRLNKRKQRMIRVIFQFVFFK